ncbi:MAG: ACT domain-containing protein [Planctomycetota bacterium]|jgi:hypothetical protein|nr:ACT domain-containing protein [Planctomycetota bacterium]
MKIKQIAIFMENKPGHLGNICKSLSDAGVNITTLSLADTQQYGILRLIVQDSDKAKSCLEKSGLVVNTTEVLAVEVEDRPGGLLAILEIIGAKEVNIEYMYAFTSHYGKRAIMIFRFNDPDKAIAALKESGIQVLSNEALFQEIQQA